MKSNLEKVMLPLNIQHFLDILFVLNHGNKHTGEKNNRKSF